MRYISFFFLRLSPPAPAESIKQAEEERGSLGGSGLGRASRRAGARQTGGGSERRLRKYTGKTSKETEGGVKRGGKREERGGGLSKERREEVGYPLDMHKQRGQAGE